MPWKPLQSIASRIPDFPFSLVYLSPMPPLTCLCSGRILFMEPVGGRFHDDTVLGDARRLPCDRDAVLSSQYVRGRLCPDTIPDHYLLNMLSAALVPLHCVVSCHSYSDSENLEWRHPDISKRRLCRTFRDDLVRTKTTSLGVIVKRRRRFLYELLRDAF